MAHGLGREASVQRRHRGGAPAEQELHVRESCDTDSASLGTVPDAAPDLEALRLAGTDMALAVRLEGEKLSSDQHTLSRRNAAEARRRPVWSSAAASSINPRWKQAWPKIKYLHWVSAVVFLEKPATTRCFSSEMSKQQRKRVAPEAASERSRPGDSNSVREAPTRLPDEQEDEEEEVAVVASSPGQVLVQLGM
uniref:Uncharacterized protein n=1 Tax=Oryza brachyantha TaxID=4533 RepID=J3MPC9_ORYBR